MDDVTRALRDDMADVRRPPMPELVPGVLVRGRRVRRNRRIGAGLGVTGSTAAVVAVAVLVAGSTGSGPSRTSAVYVGSGARPAPAADASMPAQPAPSGPDQTGRPAAASPAESCPAGSVAVGRAPVQGAPVQGAPVQGAPAAGAPTVGCLPESSPPQRGTEPSASAPVSPPALGRDASPGLSSPSPGPGAVVSAAPHPAGVPATVRGMVELLARLSPRGSLSHLVGTQPNREIQAYVTSVTGTGVLGVQLSDPGCSVGTPCVLDDAGNGVSVAYDTGDCARHTVVTVVHPDGAAVALTLASCLPAAPGTKTQPPAPLPMTVQQAVAIGSDARWDTIMSPELVAAGAAHYPTLPSHPAG